MKTVTFIPISSVLLKTKNLNYDFPLVSLSVISIIFFFEIILIIFKFDVSETSCGN